jgi:hypothetical protein
LKPGAETRRFKLLLQVNWMKRVQSHHEFIQHEDRAGWGACTQLPEALTVESVKTVVMAPEKPGLHLHPNSSGSVK